MKKLILDVDTGIDDALAIVYALSQTEEVELLGITTSFGNVLVEQATENTLAILALFERDIPVYQGAATNWGTKKYVVPQSIQRVHGKNGIGEYALQPVMKQAEMCSAADFLIQAAECYQEELIVVTLGPLTNLADASQKNLAAIKKIGRIVCMAGAVTLPGNVTPFAEANVYNDPLAAKFVLEQLAVTLVGLDVTLQTMITQKEIAQFEPMQPKSAFLAAIMRYYYQNEYQHEAFGGALHDPLAVAIALHQQLVTETIALNLTVTTTGVAIGQTIGSLAELTQMPKRTTVPLGVDAQKFLSEFMHGILHELNQNNK